MTYQGRSTMRSRHNSRGASGLVLGLAIAIRVLIACNDSNDGNRASSEGGSGGSSGAPCSTGPAYETDLGFPIQSGSASDFPACTPRCGTTLNDGLAALPSGSCSSEGESCSANTVKVLCRCKEAIYVGAVHEMRCDCENGQWRCVIVTPGSGGCSPCPDDGGIDGEPL